MKFKNCSQKEKLVEIFKLTQYRDVSILFTASDNAEIKMVHITNDMLPFHLPNEIINIIDDSIEQFDKDISSLNQHLKIYKMKNILFRLCYF